MSKHKWQFGPRFRRNGFGWRSDTPIVRLKEAISEIKQAARIDAVLAAEGAILLLEKMSPALEQVDGSSGALGTAVGSAIDILANIITGAEVPDFVRHGWLERLWQAVQDDDMPYIEGLTDYWGELCRSRELASIWADEFLPVVALSWRPTPGGSSYFKGTTACLSSLFAAQRFDELLALIEKAPFRWWHDRRWGVKALAAMGRADEALTYAEASQGRNDSIGPLARACESILLSSGRWEEAYRRYALDASAGTTYLARFRAIVKKYPQKAPADILNDLVSRDPGSEGKWFAAAKDAGLFDQALRLASSSPTDPRTLTRAARDFSNKRPAFALECGFIALHWISLGHIYELTGEDVSNAYLSLRTAATNAAIPTETIHAKIREILAASRPNSDFMAAVLRTHLVPST